MSELDEADFCVVDEGHPDEIALPNPNQNNTSEKPQSGPQQARTAPLQPPPRPIVRSASAGSSGPRPPHTPNHPPSRLGHFAGPQHQNQQSNAGSRPPAQGQNPSHAAQGHQNNSNAQNYPVRSNVPPPAAQNAANNAPPSTDSAGFFSARAVNQMPGTCSAPSKSHQWPTKSSILARRARRFARHQVLIIPSLSLWPGMDSTLHRHIAAPTPLQVPHPLLREAMEASQPQDRCLPRLPVRASIIALVRQAQLRD